MKVLWLCSIVPDVVAKDLNLNATVAGGWINGALRAVAERMDIQIAVCFPQSKTQELLSGTVGSIRYYGFPSLLQKSHRYDAVLEQWMQKILTDYQPDVTHIWGTEFPHSLAMMKVHRDPDRICISIQGLCSMIAKHSRAFVPENVVYSWTLRDLLRWDNLYLQSRKFAMRGANEVQALSLCKHIIGRTQWDYACTQQLAPDAVYHKCNETLRDEFYLKAGVWSLEKCEKHSIFVSQTGSSLKGFHLVLEAMPEILKRYPDAILHTTGVNPAQMPVYKRSAYHKYLLRLIEKFGLKDNVKFLGVLAEKDMCAQYLRSNVFVSASSIENSPNSVAEAMMLGLPIVASFVGGTMDLLKDKVEGYLYQADAPYMLAHYVCEVFENTMQANEMGRNAYFHAKLTHDKSENLQQLLRIYEHILYSTI